ncbi:MAG: M43 family zinc metalloprotease [Bacteroidota bacterium]
MKSLYLLRTLTALFFTSLTLYTATAQDLKYCGTDQAMHELYRQHPELRQAFIDNEAILDKAKPSKDKDGNTVYIIPIVFHILHQNGPENISDEQVADAVDILNRDMRKLNADTANIIPLFQPLAADIRIEFRLATIDPQGNCTNGVDRIYTSRTSYANDSSKLNPWPREKYLNVWTAKALATGWAGYAYYPSAATGDMMMRDGIMILQDYIGSIGTSNPYKSRALTHEVGHWLDLGHPWNRTINISINVGLACGDDGVEDTPVTKGHQSCPNLLTPDCSIDQLQSGLLDFSSVTTSSGTNDPTAAPAVYTKLQPTQFKATGLSSNPTAAGSFSFSGWGTGAPDAATSTAQLTGSIDLTRYYEFTIAPSTGNSMNITALDFDVLRSANGPRSFAIRLSQGNYSNNLLPALSNNQLQTSNGEVFFVNDRMD